MKVDGKEFNYDGESNQEENTEKEPKDKASTNTEEDIKLEL